MGKIIEKLKEIGKNWIKQFGEIAIIAITVILSAFTLGKIKDIIEIRDYKKKEEIKDSIDETKQTVEEIKDDITESVEYNPFHNGHLYHIRESVEQTEEIKDSINNNQKASNKTEKDYISKQKKAAKKAGFVKKRIKR